MGSFGSSWNAGVWNHLGGEVCEGCLCVCKRVLNLLTEPRERQTTNMYMCCLHLSCVVVVLFNLCLQFSCWKRLLLHICEAVS